MDEYVGRCNNETHVENKGDGIGINTFSYKGCWNCRYFELNTDCYTYVKEIAIKHNVSESTIRRWCKNDKLDATLCIRERYNSSEIFIGANKIWLIKEK